MRDAKLEVSKKKGWGLAGVAVLAGVIYALVRYRGAEAKQYVCPVCYDAFTTQEELDAHILEFHPEPLPEQYVCNVCGAPFMSLEELALHMQAEHPEEPPPTQYPCPVCGAVFGSLEALNLHIAAEHPEPPPPQYTCDICGAVFSTLEALNQHIATEHPEPSLANLHGHIIDTAENRDMKSGWGYPPVTVELMGDLPYNEAYGGAGVWTGQSSIGAYAFYNAPLGIYTLRASAVGFETDEWSVTLVAGENFFDIYLTPEPAPPPLEHCCWICGLCFATSEELMAHVATHEPPPPPPPPTMGTLVIRTVTATPYGMFPFSGQDIWVDAVFVGQSPVTVDVAPGGHDVTFERVYRDRYGVRWTADSPTTVAIVLAGQTRTVTGIYTRG